MSKERLKRCPFRGCTLLHIEVIKTGINYYAVVCQSCDFEGRREFTRQDAIEWWNTRSMQSEENEQVLTESGIPGV